MFESFNDLSFKKVITEGNSYVCQGEYGRIVATETEKELLEKICSKVDILQGETTLKNLEFLIPYLDKIDEINIFDDEVSIRTNDFDVYMELGDKAIVNVDGIFLRGNVPKWYFDIIVKILDKREIEEIKCDSDDGCYVKIDLAANREIALQEIRKRINDDKIFANVIANINGYMLKVCNENGCFVYHGSCRGRAGDLAEIFGGDYLMYYPETCGSNIKEMEQFLKERGIEIIPY